MNDADYSWFQLIERLTVIVQMKTEQDMFRNKLY